MKKLRFWIVSLAFFLLVTSVVVFFQVRHSPTDKTREEGRSWFISLVERKLSEPNRQVRFHNLQGVSSSKVSVGAITVSDNKGVWLKITNATMDWNRLALLRGYLEIERISAERIVFLRKPQGSSSVSFLKTGQLSIPKFPLAVFVNAFTVAHLTFEKDFLGLSSDVSLKGNLILANDNIHVDVEARRLDAPGYFSVRTQLSNKSGVAEVDISADEPKNGIIANVLGIEGYPPVNLVINGEGSFNDLVATLRLKTNHQLILDGNLILASASEDRSLSVQLVGEIGVLVPFRYRGFMESDLTLKAKATRTKEGAIHLDHFLIQGKETNITANAEMTADGFLRRLFVDGKLNSSKGKESTPQMLSKVQVRADDLTLTINYGQMGQKAWGGQLVIHNFSNENMNIREAVFDMGGVSENLDDFASRHVGIQINGILQGMRSSDDVLEESLDQTASIHFDADIMGEGQVAIHDLSFKAQDFSIWLKGKIDHFIFRGDLGLKAQTLEVLSLFSGRSLSGGADIKASGVIGLMNDAFDLKLLGTLNDVKMGSEIIDRALKGDLTFSGDASLQKTHFAIRDLHLKNQYSDVRAKGHLSGKNTKMDFHAQLSDLSMVDSRMKGAVTIQGSARGHDDSTVIKTQARVSEVFLVGKKMKNTTVNVDVFVDNTVPIFSSFTVFVKGEGTFSKKPLRLSASVGFVNHVVQFYGLALQGGEAKIMGDFARVSKDRVKGILDINADDISTLAALFLQKGSGRVKGNFALDEQNGQQKANLTLDIDHLTLANNEIKKLAMQADIFDPFDAIRFKGFLDVDRIRTPRIVVNRFNAYANDENGETVFNVQGILHDSVNMSLSGRMVPERLPESVRNKVQLEAMEIRQPSFHATLLKPATIMHSTDGVMVGELGFSVNGGKIVLAGSFHNALDLNLAVHAFPVSVANLWVPNLGSVGTLTGNVMIRGSFEKPDVSYDIEGRGLTVSALQNKKIPPLVLSSKGTVIEEKLTFNADLTGEGLQIQTQGTVSFDTNRLNLRVNLQNFPAHFANGFIEKNALRGVLTGKIEVSGTLRDPSAHFELFGQNLAMAVHKGVASINVNARGSYKKSTLYIERMVTTGSKGLDFSVSGHVSLNDLGLGLKVKGTVPLILIDPFLAERGTHLTGIAKILATLNGPWFKPQLVGHISIMGGSFFDSRTNFGLKNITLEGKSDGSRLIFERANAHFLGGGSVSASGYISNDLQTDLVIRLARANYSDESTIFAILTGQMTVTGHLQHDLVIGGNVMVEKAEIFIPDHIHSASSLDIKHKNLTIPIQKTLKHAQLEDNGHNQSSSEKPSSIVKFNMQIGSQNKFFVRGRGLDVELGGRINLTGPLHDMHPVGELRMIRGHFDLISQRFNFDRGQASFSGNLSPSIYFVADSNNRDTDVTVTVSGTPGNLNINLASHPSLPQDEILARLIFNRSLNELSPLQIAQLAAAVAELAGTSNVSLLGSLRSKMGLDDLYVLTDTKGNTGLHIGRYINDDIYLGLEAGSDGTTKGTINLNVSRHLRAKGSLNNDRNSDFGLFYEKDY